MNRESVYSKTALRLNQETRGTSQVRALWSPVGWFNG